MISARPLQRPAYTTTKNVEFSEWLEENQEAIESWYVQTSEWLPEQHPEDFREFAKVQFDIAVEDDERLREGLYEVMLAESDNDDG